MKFDEIVETLEANGKSIAAYQKAIGVASAAMTADPDRAAGYQLLISLANRFLDATGRLPVTSSQIDTAFANFSAEASAMVAAYKTGDAAAILAVLNRVAMVSLQRFDA